MKITDPHLREDDAPLAPQGQITFLPKAEDLAPRPPSPMHMLAEALARKDPIEVIDKLMTLADRWERMLARRAFDEAIASVRGRIPVIVKNRTVGFDAKRGSNGNRTDYKHEDLAEIARTIDPILSEFGLSYRFRTTSAIGEPVSVTCILSHRLGHSEENTLHAPRDDSGSKNGIQAIGSTVTYLERYTLKAALGLAAAEDDDGGKSEASDVVRLTVDQILHLKQLLKTHRKELSRFLKWASVERIEDIAQEYYDSCVWAITGGK